MGTLWIVCAEPKYDPTPIGNQQPHHEHQEQQVQQQQPQQRQQQQLLQVVSFGHEKPRRRTKQGGNGRWVCDVCGRTYNRGDSLAHHRSIHRGDTVCPICQSVFTRKYTMRCHMLNIHGAVVKYRGSRLSARISSRAQNCPRESRPPSSDDSDEDAGTDTVGPNPGSDLKAWRP